MIVGIPREPERLEHRVGMTPFTVAHLVRAGHTAVVEHNAGAEAHFSDRDYMEAGGEIAYSAEEVYRRADLVCQVAPIRPAELSLIRSGAIVAGFQHLAVAPRATLDHLRDLDATIIGYENIEDAKGDRPILLSISDLAGQLAIHEAAHMLQIHSGGRGILLGNTPGVPAATVLVLGAGSVGLTAARHATAIGAHVVVMDADVRKLHRLHRTLHGRVVTCMYDPIQLARYVAMADAVIGAVMIPGGRAPFLVTEEMVRSMRPGSVIVDISIDQGGCVETSRPTTLDDPTFTAHGVVHFCVPNMTANVARTASRALTDAILPYVIAIADNGLDAVIREDPGFARGIYMYRGRIVEEAVAGLLGVEVEPLAGLVEGGANP